MSGNEKKELPWWQKYTLTLNEASEYFGIGYKKLKLFVQEHSDEDFVLWNGNRALIKREQFEKYMDSQMNVIYFQHAVQKYNRIYRIQLPKITPHVCRHTYCSNMAKSGMNPKVLQYLMGHSDISVTLNTYTHLKLDDAIEEVEKLAKKQAEANEEFRHMGLKDDIPTKNGGRKLG